MSHPIDSALNTREWLYLDGNIQKGPVPASILIRLLEKGLGVSSQTMVWKTGMETWLPISMVEVFRETAIFHTKQWYYVDSHSQQKGPYITRFLLEKLKNGDLDGMSLVYSDDTDGWKKVSDVPSLKNAMMKITMEEEAVNTALKAVNDSNQAIFTYDEDEKDEGEKEKVIVMSSLSRNALSKISEDIKKSFTADDGKRYKWDHEEQDWIEDSSPESDDDDDENENENDQDSDNEEEGNGNGNGNETYDDRHSISNKNKNRNNLIKSKESDGELMKENENIVVVHDEKKKKQRKKKKAKKGPNTWVYITGLPSDITEEEVKAHFSKVGLIAINPLDQSLRIKIYRDEFNQCKGDSLLCYNAPESVALAIDILSGGYIRPNAMITVSVADFSSNSIQGSNNNNNNSNNNSNSNSSGSTDTSNDNTTTATSNSKKRPRSVISATQRKIAQSAVKQALTWNEDDDLGISKSKALRIIVLEGMFSPEDFKDPKFSDELEEDIATECSKYGEIEKITVFSKNLLGVVVIKYKTSFAAQECIRIMDGRYFAGKKLKCHYWDGVTNYFITTETQQEAELEEIREQERLDEFGNWLENEQNDLPDEFKLKVEGEE